MQFASIFLMAFLTLWLYAGITSQWYGVEQELALYNAQANLADMWAYGEGISEGDIRAVLRMEEVSQAQRRVRVSAEGSQAHKPTLTLYFLEENTINTPHLVAGAPIDCTRKASQSIWLDARFAEANGLSVGDAYAFTLSGVAMKLKIEGLVSSAEHVFFKGGTDLFPDYSKAGYGYCAISAFPVHAYLTQSIQNGTMDARQVLARLGGEGADAGASQARRIALAVDELNRQESLHDMVPWNELLLRSAQTDTVRMEERLDQVLARKVTFLLNRDNVPGVADLPSKLDMQKAIGNVFPLAFFMIAVLILVTTMSRMVTNQRTQIGTFKALGFRNRSILLHYLGYGFVLSAAGALAGLLAGIHTLPKLFFAPQQRSYSLPVWRAHIPLSVWAAVAIFVLVCTLATYASVRAILAGCAAEILRPKARIRVKHSALERGRLWRRLSFMVQWNLRDLSRSKVRSFMAVAGVAGSMMLLTCAFAIQDTLTHTQAWLYDDIQHYQTQINLQSGTPPVRAESLRSMAGGELLRMGRVEIWAGDKREATSVTVLESNALYHVTDSHRQHIVLKEGELAVSRKLAESLQVRSGDVIRWRVQGAKDWTRATVGVLSHHPMSQGITLLHSTFRKTGYTLAPTSIVTQQTDTHDAALFAADIFSSADLLAGWYESMNTLFLMTALLMVAAVLLALTVLYNLGLLAYNEMERNLATLKVIGFTSARIRKILFMQNAWLSVVGICVGYPVGQVLVRFITGSMGAQRDILPYVSARSVVLCVLVTATVSGATQMLFSGKVKRIDLVSSLKGVE